MFDVLGTNDGLLILTKVMLLTNNPNNQLQIMDSQDQEVRDERQEPQEEDTPDNTKKGKHFLKNNVEKGWLTSKSRTPRHHRGGRGWS